MLTTILSRHIIILFRFWENVGPVNVTHGPALWAWCLRAYILAVPDFLIPSPVREWGCLSGWGAAGRSPEMVHKASANTQWGFHSVSTCCVYICVSSLVLPMEYHKIRDLKQHTSIGSPSWKLEVRDGGVSWDHGVSRVRLTWRSWGQMCSRPLPQHLLSPWLAAAQPLSSQGIPLLCIPVFSVHIFPSL